MPVLGVRLEMSILHECIIFQNSLPVFVIFHVLWRLLGKLLDRDLMTVVVLENQVAEESCLLVFLELNFNVRLARALLLCRLLVRHRAVGLNNGELVVFRLHHVEVEMRFHSLRIFIKVEFKHII